MTEERTDQNGTPVAEADVGAEERLDAEAVPVETEGVASEAEIVAANAEAEIADADAEAEIVDVDADADAEAEIVDADADADAEAEIVDVDADADAEAEIVDADADGETEQADADADEAPAELATESTPMSEFSAASEEYSYLDMDESEYSSEEYAEMLAMYDETMREIAEGEIVQATIVRITDGAAILDVGFKSEGSVPLDEFRDPSELQAGDKVEVFLESLEDQEGVVVLSKKKADFLRVWEGDQDCLRRQSGRSRDDQAQDQGRGHRRSNGC